MQTITASGTTGSDGTLTLSIPVGHPDMECEVVVVVQAKSLEQRPDPRAKADLIRTRLAATGRHFSDSAADIREDRDR